MVNSIKIIVPEQLYFGGDVIYGVVELELTEPIKNRSVRLLFNAFEKTSWDEQSVVYEQRHVFLNHTLDFSVHTEKDDISRGVYRWPFAIGLPKLIPPSCVVPHGKIEYNICSYVDIPPFELKNVVTLEVGGNLFDQVAYSMPTKPVCQSGEKKYLFSSGKLKMEVTIPKFHFLVAETAPIEVTITNESVKSVDAIKVSLVTHIYCHAQSKKKITKLLRHKHIYETKMKGKTNKVCPLKYEIPDVIPTTASAELESEGDPKLVQIYHLLRIVLDVPWAVDLEIEIPIIIMKTNPRAATYPNPSPQEEKSLIQGVPLPISENKQIDISPPLSSSPLPSSSPPSSPPPSSFPPQKHKGKSPTKKEKENERGKKETKSTPPLPPPSAVPLRVSPESLPVIPAPPQTPPIYPVVANYQYPKDTNAVTVEIGSKTLNEEVEKIMDA